MGIEHESAMTGVARLRVAGVGGAGGNAIRSMVRAQVRGVDFVAINTDAQALALTEASRTLQIGQQLTRGLGAGGRPEVGLRAAEESHDAIRAALAGSDMVFITAGMGGGTGTGASPAVAMTARELGALTVAIVSTPFAFEGEARRRAAERGLAALREQVDTLLVVPNERLLQLAGKSMRMSDAYALADDVLRQGVQAISDLIAVPGHINLDFADVRAVMADAGSAWMSVGQASGEQRAVEALRAALSNPVLNLDITGARAVLVNITAGEDLMIHEVGEIVEALHQKVDADANILFGTVEDPAYEGQVKVTLVATGFEPRVSRQLAAAAPHITARVGYHDPTSQTHTTALPDPVVAPRSTAHPAATGRPSAHDPYAAPAPQQVRGPVPQVAAYERAAAAREEPAADDWNALRVAHDDRGAGRRPDRPASQDADELRVGQPRVRPATQTPESAPQADTPGFRGAALPPFLQRRR